MRAFAVRFVAIALAPRCGPDLASRARARSSARTRTRLDNPVRAAVSSAPSPQTRELPMPELRTITDGLRFPEGPVAMPDGSFLVVEIERRTVTRIAADG